MSPDTMPERRENREAKSTRAPPGQLGPYRLARAEADGLDEQRSRSAAWEVGLL